MALNPLYFTTTSLEELFVDKDTGEFLADGYIVFYSDSSRTTPKTVYELSGAPPNYTYTALPNPLSIGGSGYPVNDNNENVNIYYYPYDSEGNLELYYIVVYNSGNIEQFTREGFPNVSPADDPENEFTNGISNQLSNPQFSDVLFDPSEGLVIEFDEAISSMVYAVAPDWDIVISSTGSGTVTINQTSLAGSLAIITNPPYLLDILMGGANISSVYLRQRLYNNPDIWSTTTDGQDGYVASYMLITSIDGTARTISMQYDPSVATSPQTIATGSTGTSGYVPIATTTLLNLATNTDESDVGYVDINIILPTSGHVGITSLQAFGLETNEQNIPYQQEPVNRIRDHLFHYYNPLLQYKPIPSYLVGWDFPLNPAQFNGDSGSLGAIGANKSAYAWDQTILYQNTDEAISYSRNTDGGFIVTAEATAQFAIIQYLDSVQARKILNKPICSMVRASTTKVNGITATASLWYTSDADLPDVTVGTNNSIVSSIDSDGFPLSFNGSWTQVPRNNGSNAIFLVDEEGDEFYNNHALTGWDASITDASNTATYFAIVIGFSSLAESETVAFDSISLCSGSIPTIPAPKTEDEVLRECRFYYQKTYEKGILPGAITIQGENCQPAITDFVAEPIDGEVYKNIIALYFDEMRTAPIVTFYSPTVADEGMIQFSVRLGGTFPDPDGATTNPTNVSIEGWSSFESSTTCYLLIPIDENFIMQFGVTPSISYVASMIFQYTLDSRLGIFPIV